MDECRNPSFPVIHISNNEKAKISLALNRSSRCSVKKVFLEIPQNLQENTSATVFFLNKVTGLRPVTLLKKRLWHMCFLVNFEKFIRTPFSIEHPRWLPLIKRKVYVQKKNKISIIYQCFFSFIWSESSASRLSLSFYIKKRKRWYE